MRVERPLLLQTLDSTTVILQTLVQAVGDEENEVRTGRSAGGAATTALSGSVSAIGASEVEATGVILSLGRAGPFGALKLFNRTVSPSNPTSKTKKSVNL